MFFSVSAYTFAVVSVYVHVDFCVLLITQKRLKFRISHHKSFVPIEV